MGGQNRHNIYHEESWFVRSYKDTFVQWKASGRLYFILYKALFGFKLSQEINMSIFAYISVFKFWRFTSFLNIPGKFWVLIYIIFKWSLSHSLISHPLSHLLLEKIYRLLLKFLYVCPREGRWGEPGQMCSGGKKDLHAGFREDTFAIYSWFCGRVVLVQDSNLCCFSGPGGKTCWKSIHKYFSLSSGLTVKKVVSFFLI